MIKDLDVTIESLLHDYAPPNSELKQAPIKFDMPDERWQNGISTPTVNCYLYDLRESAENRLWEPWIQSENGSSRAARRLPPMPIDCGYCITTWTKSSSVDIDAEHRLMSQVLGVLVRFAELPEDVLKGSLADMWYASPARRIHFRTAVARSDGIKNVPEFWGTFNQQIRPSVNYVVTLPFMVDVKPDEMTPTVEDYTVDTDYCEPVGQGGASDPSTHKCNEPNDV